MPFLFPLFFSPLFFLTHYSITRVRKNCFSAHSFANISWNKRTWKHQKEMKTLNTMEAALGSDEKFPSKDARSEGPPRMQFRAGNAQEMLSSSHALMAPSHLVSRLKLWKSPLYSFFFSNAFLRGLQSSATMITYVMQAVEAKDFTLAVTELVLMDKNKITRLRLLMQPGCYYLQAATLRSCVCWSPRRDMKIARRSRI